MRRILVYLWLLSNLAWCQTAITGLISDSTGHPATSGYVQFDLIPKAQNIPYAVVGNSSINPQTARCAISAAGQVVDSLNGGTCNVWPNSSITPANSLYKITIAPKNVVTNVIQNVVISGTTVDLSNLTVTNPKPVLGFTTNASPLISQSIVPSYDSVWDLGQPNLRYAHLYVNVLNISQLSGLGFQTANSVFGNCTSIPANFAVCSITAAMLPNIPVANLNSGTNADGNSFWRGDGSWKRVVQVDVFANLPGCNSGAEGLMQAVTDSNTITWGATVAGGSTNHVLAYCDGTNWTVMGK